MAVLHKTAAYVLLLLLYLHVPGTAPHALPQHPNSHGTGGEVHASLQDNTLSPVQSAAIPHIAENDALTDASNLTSASSTPREHLEHPESTPDASTSTSSPRESQHPESTPDASTLTSSPREHLEHPLSTSDVSTSSPREHLEHPVSTLDASTSASSPREHREHPESTQDRTWKEKEQRNYLGRQTKLKENMTQMMKIESSGGKDDATTSENDKADAGLRQEEKVKGVISSGGWFTDTLNVTLRPVVTWMRRPASPRHPSTLRKEERKDKEEDVEEERRGREGEDDILLTVTFLMEDQPLILDLHPTWDLLAASYTESSGGGGGGDTLLGEVSVAVHKGASLINFFFFSFFFTSSDIMIHTSRSAESYPCYAGLA
ncbi:hypothetical protein GWK47_023850 [Chionoecetes opilio]|uniref:Uncharacterized protein n=1 Tax=Chionoecetes opilio TaxID=41210 RepID=A0A8J5CJI2_CHIOP|nr:hypothetical protein GWK47_023850 [Chionoecetes opilio]